MIISLKKILTFLPVLTTILYCVSAGELHKYFKNLPFDMSSLDLPHFKKDTLNIIDYGAVSNGYVMNTQSFNKAIEQCSKNGGGVVYVPQGIWLTGPIRLRSSVNLHIEKGGIILFHPRFEDYPLIQTSWEGREEVRCLAPISGTNLENIAITGKGVIDGSGEAWRPVKRFKMTDNQWKNLVESGGTVNKEGNIWWPSSEAMNGANLIQELTKKNDVDLQEYAAAREYLRPVMVSLVQCRNILLDGPTFQNSPAWNIHPLMCENMIIRNIKVRNPWYSQNGDGLDLESCRNVIIYNCSFDVGDDAICLKSGRNEYGRKRGIPSEHIVIDGCIVYHGHGGFTVGSEMSGGIRNIVVRNCVFLGTDVGLRFKTTRGRGGVVENIYISDIYMKDIPADAIRFNMFYNNNPPIPENGEIAESAFKEQPGAPVSVETPRFHDIHLKNIICRGAEQAILLRGLPEMALQQIEFEDIFITAKRGFVGIDIDQVTLRNVTILSEEVPVMAFLNSKRVLIDSVKVPEGTDLFISINGTKSDDIKILRIDGLLNKNMVNVGKEVSSDALLW